MRLSVEVIPVEENTSDAEVHVYLDREGLDFLLSQISLLKQTDDLHLFAPSWGGDCLTEERWHSTSAICKHLKFFMRPDGELPTIVEPKK